MSTPLQKPLSIAFVLPYGEPLDAFFPDTFLGMLCTLANDEGHRAEMVRVYYHGSDRSEDERIDDRFVEWLSERSVDLLVFERVLDPRPVFRHRASHPDAKSLVVCRGDSLDPVPGIDYAIGAIAAPTERGSRRASTNEAFVVAFREFIAALASRRSVPRSSMPSLALAEPTSATSASSPTDAASHIGALRSERWPPARARSASSSSGQTRRPPTRGAEAQEASSRLSRASKTSRVSGRCA